MEGKTEERKPLKQDLTVFGVVQEIWEKQSKAGKPYWVYTVFDKRVSSLEKLGAKEGDFVSLPVVQKGDFINFDKTRLNEVIVKPPNPNSPAPLMPQQDYWRKRLELDVRRQGEIRREACLNTAASIVLACLPFTFKEMPVINAKSVKEKVVEFATELEAFVMPPIKRIEVGK